jgi:hypothetical protein
MPSILIQRLRSVDADCQAVTKATTSGQNIAIAAQAIGMTPASAADPLTFRFMIQSGTMQANYQELNPSNTPAPVGNNPDGLSSFLVSITSGTAVSLDPKAQATNVTVDPQITIGQQAYTQVVLKSLVSGQAQDLGYLDAPIVVQVDGSQGRHAQRVVNLRIYDQGEIMPYDQNIRPVHRFPAVPVSGCSTGSATGSDITLSENMSESKSRSLSFNWNYSVASELGLSSTVGIDGGVQLPLAIWHASASLSVTGNASRTWSNAYGFDVSQQVSSEQSVGHSIQAHIIPGMYGRLWRQATMQERYVTLVYHNACGSSAAVGQVALTDWVWGYDPAVGAECSDSPTLPGTSLPGEWQASDGG